MDYSLQFKIPFRSSAGLSVEFYVKYLNSQEFRHDSNQENLMEQNNSSCKIHNLNALWNILMILYSYVEQVMTMCPVQ